MTSASRRFKPMHLLRSPGKKPQQIRIWREPVIDSGQWRKPSFLPMAMAIPPLPAFRRVNACERVHARIRQMHNSAPDYRARGPVLNAYVHVASLDVRRSNGLTRAGTTDARKMPRRSGALFSSRCVPGSGRAGTPGANQSPKVRAVHEAVTIHIR